MEWFWMWRCPFSRLMKSCRRPMPIVVASIIPYLELVCFVNSKCHVFFYADQILEDRSGQSHIGVRRVVLLSVPHSNKIGDLWTCTIYGTSHDYYQHISTKTESKWVANISRFVTRSRRFELATWRFVLVALRSMLLVSKLVTRSRRFVLLVSKVE